MACFSDSEAFVAPAAIDPAVPFLERRRGQCAWPLWGEATPRAERLVCGAPTLAQSCSWCARHARIVRRELAP